MTYSYKYVTCTGTVLTVGGELQHSLCYDNRLLDYCY